MIIEMANMSEVAKWEEAARVLFAAKKSEGYEQTAVHLYRSSDGSIHHARVRMTRPTNNGTYDKYIRPFWFDGSQWKLGEPDTGDKKPLYGLTSLLSFPDALVVLTEGEQKADAVTKIGAGALVGVTSGSAHSASSADWTFMSGRQVLLWPDNDAPGHKYADDAAAKLGPLNCSIDRLNVAAMGLPQKGDIMDWLQNFRGTLGREPVPDDILALPRVDSPSNSEMQGTCPHSESQSDIAVKQSAALLTKVGEAIALTVAGDAGALFEIVSVLTDLRSTCPADYARVRTRIRSECRNVSISELERQMRTDVNVSDEKSTADLLIEMTDERCDLFRDPDRCAYALIKSDGHQETWAVRSEGFREWLSFSFYQQYGRAPTDMAITTALATIEGKAKFDGEERLTYMRVATANGSIWIDLCNDKWQAVEVTVTGWKIVDAPPVRFIRTASMRALPMPTVHNSLEALWDIVNVPKSERLLVIAWMLECFRSTTPYALLELTGEQGSAKSTTQHFLRELIDPNRSNNRAAPKNVDDVFVAAQNAHLMSFENLSHLAAAYQDALCVLATGGGYSTRRLFTNTSETVIDLKRPIALNGIAIIVTAQDLTDRTLHIDLPTVAARATAKEIQQAFDVHRDSIFGALLNVFAASLAMLQKVSTEDLKLPRMADFAQLGEAVYRVHGKPPGAFLQDYADRMRDSVHRSLEASPVAMAMLAYLEANPNGFEGTIGRLYEVLTGHRQDTEAWPKSAKGMGDAFRRVAPALRQIGIAAWASKRRGTHGYTCSLKRIATSCAPAVDIASANVHNVHQVQRDSSPGITDERYEHHELGFAQPHCIQLPPQETCVGPATTETEVEDDL
jgi:hypothetical protein